MTTVEVGSKLEGKVTGITRFGAFVELPNGKTGLVHISEIADHYVKNIEDILKVDDVVKVKVINVGDDGKVGLSIKQAQAQAQAQSQSSPKSNRRPPRKKQVSFEDKMSRFLKDSEDRLTSLKRHMDSKRGGRGGSRRG